MTATEVNVKELSSEIGINSNELVRQSLLLFIWEKLRDVKTGLFVLQKKYNVETVFEFEKLYETGEIEEGSTFSDYQKFDRLAYEQDIFEKYKKKLS